MRKTFEFVKVGGVWFYWWPDYEENQQRRIDLLESKILLFEREREAFIRHLREGNIQLLKDYLGIKDE